MADRLTLVADVALGVAGDSSSLGLEAALLRPLPGLRPLDLDLGFTLGFSSCLLETSLALMVKMVPSSYCTSYSWSSSLTYVTLALK